MPTMNAEQTEKRLRELLKKLTPESLYLLNAFLDNPARLHYTISNLKELQRRERRELERVLDRHYALLARAGREGVVSENSE